VDQTNVGIHRASVAVELGDAARVVEQARAIDPSRLPSLERRAHHLLDLAQGYGQWRKDHQALDALLHAERLAPKKSSPPAAGRPAAGGGASAPRATDNQAEAPGAGNPGRGPGRVRDHDPRSNRPVLYVIACAAPPAMDVQVLINLAQRDGWDVCLIATPRAFQWLDVPGLGGAHRPPGPPRLQSARRA
jgi:hypothetical protein